jgi:3-methyl-2-oxobutanoate hydroxymethyltransferase
LIKSASSFVLNSGLLATIVFAIVLEMVPEESANYITDNLTVPTIGIGAGPDCDGQVLVTNDMLGWNSGYVPKFVRHYADLKSQASQAFAHYRADVKQGKFPGAQESFSDKPKG